MCAPTHLRVHVVHVPAISCSHMVASHIHLGMEPWVAAAVLWGPPSGLLTLPVRLEYAMLPATVARTLLPVLALFHTSGVETAYVPARPCTRHMCVHFCIPCLHAPGGGQEHLKAWRLSTRFPERGAPLFPSPPHFLLLQAGSRTPAHLLRLSRVAERTPIVRPLACPIRLPLPPVASPAAPPLSFCLSITACLFLPVACV